MAAGYLLSSLSGCTPKYSVFKTDIVDKKISIPISLFYKSSFQLVRPAGWYYDIGVQKNNESTYSALLLRCTHQDNQLTLAGNGFHCNLHGSQFDKNGSVMKGPAERSLEQYKTYLDKDNLIIEI